ncbi:MAG: hypothetical protein AAGC46_07210 [Solirubrobacteraceae bacterium]|nr:hypothetical protein [Patulibacter sp.]
MPRERTTPRGGPGRPPRPERPLDRHRHRLRNANFGSAIYGEILVLSVLAAFGEGHAAAGVVLGTVLASQLVFWLAHAYAETIEAQLNAGRDGIGWRGVLHVMEHEWPLVQAAGPTALFMLLSIAGVWSVDTAVDLSVAVAVIELFGWGAGAAHRRGRALLPQVVAGALSGALGLGIVALKLLINH